LLEFYIRRMNNATPRHHFVGEHAVEIFRRATRRVAALGEGRRARFRLLENRVQMSVQQADDSARRFPAKTLDKAPMSTPGTSASSM